MRKSKIIRAIDIVFNEYRKAHGVVMQQRRSAQAAGGSEMKAWIGFAALAAALPLGAFPAEAAPSAVARACAKDVKALCGSVKPGGGAKKACVSENFSKLSVDCQIAIVKAAAVGRACKADARKLCADVKPGGNSVAKCLEARAADLSDGCKDAMAKIEAGVR